MFTKTPTLENPYSQISVDLPQALHQPWTPLSSRHNSLPTTLLFRENLIPSNLRNLGPLFLRPLPTSLSTPFRRLKPSLSRSFLFFLPFFLCLFELSFCAAEDFLPFGFLGYRVEFRHG
jgi:hypothetical protein